MFSSSSCLLARVYDGNEIFWFENSLTDKDVVAITQKFLTSKNPNKHINSLIKSKGEVEQYLYLEAVLYHLLDEVSYKVKQPYLDEFVQQMIDYQPKAMKYHDEGRLEVPIYAIRAKAMGVENIWLAAEFLSYYQATFELNPINALIKLELGEQVLSKPQFLGLKNAIDTMSLEAKAAVSKYLQERAVSHLVLNEFTVYFALKIKDKALINNKLIPLDEKNQKLLLRSLPKVFADGFVIEQLMNAIDSNQNPHFALSLLAPYVDKDKSVKDYALLALDNESLAVSAAFVLSKTKDVQVINSLKLKYQKSSSKALKNNIKILLKMNRLPAAKIVLADLLMTGEVQ